MQQPVHDRDGQVVDCGAKEASLDEEYVFGDARDSIVKTQEEGSEKRQQLKEYKKKGKEEGSPSMLPERYRQLHQVLNSSQTGGRIKDIIFDWETNKNKRPCVRGSVCAFCYMGCYKRGTEPFFTIGPDFLFSLLKFVVVNALLYFMFRNSPEGSMSQYLSRVLTIA